MRQIMIHKIGCTLIALLCMLTSRAENEGMRYYFRTWDIRSGLSQNTVNAILQDQSGMMWFGTKDGLNRFDGLSFRVFKTGNSDLGNDYITALHEANDGRIWIGTDGGVYVYTPEKESFVPFTRKSKEGVSIRRTVTQISSDARGRVWIASDDEGLFCYDALRDELTNPLLHLRQKEHLANVTRFWFDSNDTLWLSLYAANLCYSTDGLHTLKPFRDAEGKETFDEDIINAQIDASPQRRFVGSSHGLTEIDLSTRRVRRILTAYVRSLCLKSNTELWVGTENGLYIYNLANGHTTHILSPGEEDPYSLADNAIYALSRDREGGMWIGSYFGGVNYYPHQYTYFEKYYPHDGIDYLGRRVREFCPGHDGTLWIGTEDKGLFHFFPETGKIEPFTHPAIGKNVHGLCLDGDELWVGTFSEGLSRVNLRTHQVHHYQKGLAPNTLNANDIFTICKTSKGGLLIGTTSGLLRYNRATDDFTRIPELANVFVHYLLEDHTGNVWAATYSNGLFCYDAKRHTWTNFSDHRQGISVFLPYNKMISIYEDSRHRLWFMTQGAGFFRYDPPGKKFVRYDMSDGFPSNIIYRMVEDDAHNLWLTTGNGLVCFNPDNGSKRIYTTANGLLSNQFNYQSGYKDKNGYLYMGSIDGFIRFDPATFVVNMQVPPIRITDILWFNKRIPVAQPGSPLKQGIPFADRLTLRYDQNSFTLHVAALSYQAPEMNRLIYKLSGVDKEWHDVHDGTITYSNLPYGTHVFHLKGSNSDGVWNVEERTLEIQILPPFYLSGWAYFVYWLLAIGTVVQVIRYFYAKTRRRHRRALEKLEHEKERELYTAKVEFFTNVAHEIRTPLTLIKSPLENVLKGNELPDNVRGDLEIMDLNAQRLLNLVNQLLDFRKTESDGFRLTFVRCNISHIVSQTYMRFTPIARQQQVEFTLDCPKDIQASVDREAFTKVVSNLLNNAVKYTKTYVHVSLSVHKDHFTLTVSNDGKRIPEHVRGNIFKPFIQYRDENARKTSGTGIGLALARSLTELHGGTLNMDDAAPDNTFVLTLPLTHAQTLDIGQAPTKELPRPTPETNKATLATTSATDQGQPPHYTVLVVEDNADMQAFIGQLLASDYRVLTAPDGLQALDVLHEHTVNLVISDVMMPEMDGFMLCERIKMKVETSHIPVILITAKTTLQAKLEGLKLGADAYIEKPFSVEYLKVTVANLLKSREKLQETFTHSPLAQTNSIAQTQEDEKFLQALNDFIMQHMQDPEFKLDDIAERMNMSRSSLNRKIRGILDMTPNDYLRLARLKRAAMILKNGECKVNEVCYAVGFNTPSYFTRCFVKQFGMLPKDFIAKGQK